MTFFSIKEIAFRKIYIRRYITLHTVLTGEDGQDKKNVNPRPDVSKMIKSFKIYIGRSTVLV